MKYYHVTPEKNLKTILQEGLKPMLGKYSEAMGETEAGIWMFPSIEDAKEMAPIWLEPFYGTDLILLLVDLPDGWPLEYTGSDYEVISREKISPKYISVAV